MLIYLFNTLLWLSPLFYYDIPIHLKIGGLRVYHRLFQPNQVLHECTICSFGSQLKESQLPLENLISEIATKFTVV